jgi:cysteinyl-tRNA synthetase
MDEDFNTPKALASIFEISKEINKFIDEHKQVSHKILEKTYQIFSEMNKALGLYKKEKTKDVEGKIVDDLKQLLFELREKLRKKGDYGLSDEIRTRLKESGLIIEDTVEGPKWKLA